ncbi:MAG: hypothetical protein ACPLRU_04700, partial [Desulfofundulus sp.]
MSRIASKPATREGALEEALNQIKTRFGDGATMLLAENPRMNVEAIPTGVSCPWTWPRVRAGCHGAELRPSEKELKNGGQGTKALV